MQKYARPVPAQPRRPRVKPRVRPWLALTTQAQTQVAQHLSRLAQRLRLSQEARRADETA